MLRVAVQPFNFKNFYFLRSYVSLNTMHNNFVLIDLSNKKQILITLDAA